MKKKMMKSFAIAVGVVSLFGLASCGSKVVATTSTPATTEAPTTTLTPTTTEVESTTTETTTEVDYSVTTEVFLEEYYKIFDAAMKKDFGYEGKKTTTKDEAISGTYDVDNNLAVYEDNTHYSLYNIKEDGKVYDYKKATPEFETIRDVILKYAGFNTYMVLYATSDAKCTIHDNEYKVVNGNDSITINVTEEGLTLAGNNTSEGLTFELTLKYGNVETTLL